MLDKTYAYSCSRFLPFCMLQRKQCTAISVHAKATNYYTSLNASFVVTCNVSVQTATLYLQQMCLEQLQISDSVKQIV